MADIRFTWQFLTEVINKIPKPTTFLLDTVFKGVETHYGTRIVTDVRTGQVKMAPLVRVGRPGKVVDRPARSLEELTNLPSARIKTQLNPEKLAEERPVGSDLFLAPGETPPDPMERALTEVLEEHGDYITRRHEWLAAMALTGTISYVDKDQDLEFVITFPGVQTITLSGTNLWDDASSKPATHLRSWQLLIAKAVHMIPDLLIMGENAYMAFLDNSSVQAWLDKLRIDPGQITEEGPTPEGVIPIGSILGMKAYAYVGTYLDDATNTVKNYVDPDHVIMLATRARFKKHYAAVHDADLNITVPRQIFTKSWTEQDPSVRWILSDSRMIPIPHWPESIVYAKVL